MRKMNLENTFKFYSQPMFSGFFFEIVQRNKIIKAMESQMLPTELNHSKITMMKGSQHER